MPQHLSASLLALAVLITPLVSNAQYSGPIYLSRSDAVELLLRASREITPDPSGDAIDYPDVFGTGEETKYIRYAIEINMLDPDPIRGLIYPYRSISRAEFLKMMTVAFNLETNLPYSFKDIKDNEWYAPHVGIADYYKMFADAPSGGELKPHLKMTKGTARVALDAFYQKEPLRKPKNFTYDLPKEKKKGLLSTPNIVKKYVINLFSRKEGVRPVQTRQEILNFVNQERVKAGLHPLAANLHLRIAAQRHAKDMHKRGYFSHTTPEGIDYVDRIRAANYLVIDQTKCGCKSVFNLKTLMEQGSKVRTPNSIVAQTKVCECLPSFAVGENIAQGQLTPREAVEDWMNSPGHKANILHKEFNEIGIGLYGDYWVQNFGRMSVE